MQSCSFTTYSNLRNKLGEIQKLFILNVQHSLPDPSIAHLMHVQTVDGVSEPSFFSLLNNFEKRFNLVMWLSSNYSVTNRKSVIYGRTVTRFYCFAFHCCLMMLNYKAMPSLLLSGLLVNRVISLFTTSITPITLHFDSNTEAYF